MIFIKIYKKSINIFLTLSILLIIVAIICFCQKWNTIGNFVLGLFASTLVVTIQSSINYKIELSKEIIPYVKEIRKSAINLASTSHSPFNRFILFYKDIVYETKNECENLINNISILNDMDTLKANIKEEVSKLYKEIIDFYDKVYLILLYFEDSDEKQKRYLYIELMKQISECNYEKIHDYCFNIAVKTDYDAFINVSSFKENEEHFRELKFKIPKELFINKIIDKNSVEYMTYKVDFERNEKLNKSLKEEQK